MSDAITKAAKAMAESWNHQWSCDCIGGRGDDCDCGLALPETMYGLNSDEGPCKADFIVAAKAALAALQPSPARVTVPSAVEPLDLSNMLKHAFHSGQTGVTWVEYDPAGCPAYERIRSALQPSPARVGVTPAMIEAGVLAYEMTGISAEVAPKTAEKHVEYILNAALSSLEPSPAPVAVKKLEWQQTKGGAWVAQAARGEYLVSKRIDGRGWNCSGTENETLRLEGTLAEAKTAAEVDAQRPAREEAERDGWIKVVGDIAAAVPLPLVLKATGTTKDLITYFQGLDARATAAEAQAREAALATHRQAYCIQQCAAYISPDTAATVDGLPRAVKHLTDRATVAEARVKELEADCKKLRAAFRANALHWNPEVPHAEIDEAIDRALGRQA